MKKAVASVAIITFAGLLCTSLLAIFNGSLLETHIVGSLYDHISFMAY